MAIEYNDVISDQWHRMEGEKAAWQAELEAARHAHDHDRLNAASDNILALDVKMQALASRANNYVAANQQAQAQSQRDPLLDNPVMRNIIKMMPYKYDNGEEMSLADKAKTYRWSAKEQAEKARREAEDAVMEFSRE